MNRSGSLTFFDKQPLAPLIAIIGCDGAGKTSLATHLCKQMESEGAAYAYLGLGSGTVGLKIQGWPLIGPMLARRLMAKAKQARTKGERIPGVLTALVIYFFSLLRVRRFRAMLALRKQRGVVICDRYPQLEFPGLFDGPGLSAARPRGWFTAWLARRELKFYERMVHVRPTLVIRLNIDAETAYARKPDHNLALLRQKAQVTPLLRFNGATIVDVDAGQSQDQVQAECIQLAYRLIDDAQQRVTPCGKSET